MKVLLTGNEKRGLAMAVKETMPHYEYQVDCISRRSGFDLMTEEGRESAAKKSVEYDIFINNSKLDNFCQTLLLKKIYDTWKEHLHTGHIINIGSTVDTGLKGGSRLYTVEKVALKNLSRKLTYDASSGNGIKVSYISFGYLDTQGVSFADKVKLDLVHAVDMIMFAIEAPDYVNVNEISIDTIQKGE